MPPNRNDCELWVVSRIATSFSRLGGSRSPVGVPRPFGAEQIRTDWGRGTQAEPDELVGKITVLAVEDQGVGGWAACSAIANIAAQIDDGYGFRLEASFRLCSRWAHESH